MRTTFCILFSLLFFSAGSHSETKKHIISIGETAFSKLNGEKFSREYFDPAKNLIKQGTKDSKPYKKKRKKSRRGLKPDIVCPSNDLDMRRPHNARIITPGPKQIYFFSPYYSFGERGPPSLHFIS